MEFPELWCVRLAELRKGRGLSQTELAEKSGVSQELISQLEHGKRPFTQKSLDLILEELDANYEQLFTRKRLLIQPVDNIDYRKWKDDVHTIRRLEKELNKCNAIIEYAKTNCTQKTCPIMKIIS